MTTANPQVRRATVDDLPRLIPLWKKEDMPWEKLEKRFKEFQVVEAAGGDLVGALGLEIAATEGRVHSEVFARPEQADELRELLWERAQVLARNFGLIRVWSQFSTPFWNHSGFRYATPEAQTKLPSSFAGDPHPWQVLQLREEPSGVVNVEKEFAAFKEMERQRTARLHQQAKALKAFAAVVLIAVFALLILWIVAWMRARGRIQQ